MTCQEIKELIEKEKGLNLAKRVNLREYVDVRCIFYYCCIKYSTETITYHKLAQLVNKKHCTVMYNYKNYNNFYDTDLEFRKLANIIIEKVKRDTDSKNLLSFERIDNFDTEELKKRVKNSKIIINELRDEIEFLTKELKKAEKLKNIEVVYKNIA